MWVMKALRDEFSEELEELEDRGRTTIETPVMTSVSVLNLDAAILFMHFVNRQ